MLGDLHVITDDIGETPDDPGWIDTAREGLDAACAPLLGAHAAFAEYLANRGE